MRQIVRYAYAIVYDIVLFTINRYFTCFEAVSVNLEQTLTVQ